MNILKEINKLEKSISKYIYKCLNLPKSVKQFVTIEYCTYHREIHVFYNDRHIGKIGSEDESVVYSKRKLIENIIKDYASSLALSDLKEN